MSSPEPRIWEPSTDVSFFPLSFLLFLLSPGESLMVSLACRPRLLDISPSPHPLAPDLFYTCFFFLPQRCLAPSAVEPQHQPPLFSFTSRKYHSVS